MPRCDMIPQCPHGEDEEGCHIPDSVRQMMSLFFFFSLSLSSSSTHHSVVCLQLLSLSSSSSLPSPRESSQLSSIAQQSYRKYFYVRLRWMFQHWKNSILSPRAFRCIQFHGTYSKSAIIFVITAGVAVLLTIITYFSTPIMTKIFGNGSLEVISHNHKQDYEEVQVFFLNI